MADEQRAGRSAAETLREARDKDAICLVIECEASLREASAPPGGVRGVSCSLVADQEAPGDISVRMCDVQKSVATRRFDTSECTDVARARRLTNRGVHPKRVGLARLVFGNCLDAQGNAAKHGTVIGIRPHAWATIKMSLH